MTFSKEKKILIFLILSGFILRWILIWSLPIINDESMYFQDASQILQGLMPFRDYLSRAPGLIYLLALFLKIFGFHLWTGRLLSIFSALLTAFFLYLIGRKLFSEKTGLIAAGFYLLFPICLVNTTYLLTEPLQQAFLVISIYLFVLGLKNSKWFTYLFSGAFLGFAFLVRPSAIFYLPFFIFLIIWLSPSKRTAFWSLLDGLFLTLGPILFYLSWQADWWPIFMHICLGLALFKRFILPKEILLGTTGVYWSEILTVFRHSLFFGLILILFSKLLFFKKHTENQFWPIGFIGGWFLVPLASYLAFSHWEFVYFTEFLPVLCLFSGVVLNDIIEKRNWILITLIILALFLSIGFSGYLFIKKPVSGTWSVETVLAGVDYLQEITQPNDEIFTAAGIFPVLAKCKIALNISHPTVYKRPNYLVYHWPTPPPFYEILNYLKKNQVKYILNDLFTYRCYFRQSPQLEKYLEENYHLIKIIPNKISQPVEIYERK